MRRPKELGDHGTGRTPCFAPWSLLRPLICGAFLAVAAVVALPAVAAHGVAEDDSDFLRQSSGTHVGPFLYLGAKHMVTGYDHLLFLVGVVFFLYRLKDVLTYVTLFTVGHSLTLIGGVLGGIDANPYLIDAIIGLSVVYKAFDNLNGFRLYLGWQPDARVAVAVFGLFHGFGLATKLQDLQAGRQGLLANLLAFNLGVEIGQFLALAFILIAITAWRRSPSFAQHAFLANVLLMTGGFLLLGFQLGGLAWAE